MYAAAIEVTPSPLQLLKDPPPLTERELLPLALAALKDERDLFIRNGHLVEVARSPAPAIVELDRYSLRERFFTNERWQNGIAGRLSRMPFWLETQLLRRREWEGLRPLKGLIHAPVLRPDGTVITERGYDEATGLYLTDAAPFRLPVEPSQDDARKAYRQLVEFTKPLPLQNSTHRAAFIASMLTPLARLAIDGAAPLFLFDSPTDRAPPMLADAASIVVRGKPITQLEKPPSERVFRRRLAQAELKDETLILIEGAEKYRSGEALKTGLFQRAWVDGDARSQESHAVTWYGAGCNVSLTNEVAALVLPIRTEATEDENGQPLWTPPRGFEKSVLRDRPQLLAAAMTILRAYVAAGSPRQEVGSLPQFEAWADLVAGAIVWAGGRNPLETRQSLGDYVDDDGSELHTLLIALHILLCTLPPETQGMTVSQLLHLLKGVEPDPDVLRLREALEAYAPGNWRAPRKLGALLKEIRGKRVDGLFIHRVGHDRKGLARWAVCGDHRSPDDVRANGRPLDTASPEESLHPAERLGVVSAESAESIHATDEVVTSPSMSFSQQGEPRTFVPGRSSVDERSPDTRPVAGEEISFV